MPVPRAFGAAPVATAVDGLLRALERHVRGDLPSFWIYLPPKVEYGGIAPEHIHPGNIIQAVQHIERAPIGVVGDTGVVADVIRTLGITEGVVRDAHSDHPDYTVADLLRLHPLGARDDLGHF